MVLSLTPAEVGARLPDLPDDLLALVVDLPVGQGAASLACIADGTTSLYFSSGGGILGAGGREPVRAATATLLRLAYEKLRDRPLAELDDRPGEVTFRLIAADGRRDVAVPVDDLTREHELFELWAAANEVLTQVRLHSE